MRIHPIEGQDRVVLLKPLITSPLIEVGEYSYYDDSGSTRLNSRRATSPTTTVPIA